MLTKMCHLGLAAVLVAILAGCSGLGIKTAADADNQAPSDVLSSANGEKAGKPVEASKAVNTEIAPAMLYQLLVAEVALQRGQLGVAVANYLDAAKFSRDPKAAARAAQIARYSKDFDNAIEAASLWVDIEPDNPEAQLTLASIYMHAGQPGKSVAHFTKFISLNKGKSDQGFNLIADQLARVPDRAIAMSVMEQVVQPWKDNPGALFAYAHLAMRQANFDLALSTLDAALDKKPEWVNAIKLRSRILALQRGKDAALKYLNDILQGPLSDNLEIGVTYARMLVEAKQFEAALVQFVRLTELAPKNLDLYYPAGVLALQLEDLDQARSLLSKVAKSGSRHYEANYYLGQVAEQQNKPETAIEHYLQVRRGDLYFNAQLRVVSLLASKKEFADAKQHLLSIRSGNPRQDLQQLLMEGDLLREQGLFPEAKAFYSEQLAKLPNETSLRYARALVAEKLGEIELVESDLQLILKVEPANAQVLNALGYTLADRTNRFDEALGYIKKAMGMEPNDAAIMDSMGWVLYRMGNYEEAIGHLRRAIEVAKDPEIAAHLGEVLWVSGNRDAARDVWQNSLEGNPDHKILIEVIKRFDQ